jgi:hypothetical protein
MPQHTTTEQKNKTKTKTKGCCGGVLVTLPSAVIGADDNWLTSRPAPRCDRHPLVRRELRATRVVQFDNRSFFVRF